MRFVSILFVTGALALATPVTGTLNFTGNAQLSTNTMNFQCDLLGICSGTNGDFFVTGGSANSGEFAIGGSILNRFGQVRDIVAPPLNVPFLLPNFTSFIGNPDVTLDLTEVFAGTGGSCPPSASASCTPPGSPLTILATPTGSIATLSVLAQARRISTGETIPYQGLFTLQFTQLPGTVLSELSSGETVDTSYSVTFSPRQTVVPEPGSMFLLAAGTGLILLGKRRASKN